MEASRKVFVFERLAIKKDPQLDHRCRAEIAKHLKGENLKGELNLSATFHICEDKNAYSRI
jgi:hypothetical protein